MSQELETLFQEEIYSIASPLVIVIAKPWNELTEDEHATLTRMLGALRLSLAAVQIIHRSEFSVEELSTLAPTRVLAFGAIPKPALPLYENQNLNGISIIISESLNELDDPKKKILWTALRGMFNL
jgi:hypothetical protein